MINQIFWPTELDIGKLRGISTALWMKKKKLRFKKYFETLKYKMPCEIGPNDSRWECENKHT